MRDRGKTIAPEGDILVVTKLDRLARSIPDLVRIIEKLEEKQATLRILAMNLDTDTPTGRLLLNLVGSISQFEREIMLERQREGVAKAICDGFALWPRNSRSCFDAARVRAALRNQLSPHDPVQRR